MSLVHERRKNQEKYKTGRLQAVRTLSDILYSRDNSGLWYSFIRKYFFDETVFSIVLYILFFHTG